MNTVVEPLYGIFIFIVFHMGPSYYFQKSYRLPNLIDQFVNFPLRVVMGGTWIELL